MIKNIKEFDFKNKRVLVRCDFNVPLDKNGLIEDDFRIRQTVPTINYLVGKGARVILMSHLGKPGGKKNKALKLEVVRDSLAQHLIFPVIQARDCIGRKVKKQVSKLRDKEILLLENIRFYKEEEENDYDFSKNLAELADIYINDAFGVCHRRHASVVGVPEFLPSGAGFLLEKEIKVLSQVLEKPWRPLVAIIGGVKIESKLKVIEQFLEKADHLLIGGKIADPILAVKKISFGKPLPPEDIIREIEKFNLTSTKLHLPVDALVSSDESGSYYVRESGPANTRKDEYIFDIGPETINIFSNIIKEAKMIIWSGPLGFFENSLFGTGTKEIAEEIVKNQNAYRIVGGGDTLNAVSKFGLRDKFDHVSTGGGAMLTFLGGEKLPGLEALER